MRGPGLRPRRPRKDGLFESKLHEIVSCHSLLVACKGKMKIKDIEDLIVWKEARNLRNLVYEISDKYPKEEKYITVRHMKSCSRNVPANIAEGFGRYNYQESVQFYRIARGSLLELKSDVYCSLDSNFLDKEDFSKLLEKINQVGMLLNGFIKSTLKVKNHTSNE